LKLVGHAQPFSGMKTWQNYLG